MRGKDLLEGMSYVDERFVEEAEFHSFPQKRTNLWIRVASVAACLCVIVFALYQLKLQAPPAAPGSVAPGSAAPGNIPEENDPGFETPGEIPASKAPEMMVRILKLTETGFVGTVENDRGFPVFDYGTEITVTVDRDTDPDFTADDYQIGDLIHVMYTDWNVEERTILASILGIVDEPMND